MGKAAKRVQVVGDLIREHNIYKGARLTPDAAGFNGTTQISATAGAELLHDILCSISDVASEANETIFNAAIERGYTQDLITSIPANLTGYSIWEPTPGDSDKHPDVWRMIQHLGYGPLTPEKPWSAFFDCPAPKTGRAPAVLAVEDAGFGYRFKTASKSWPGCILPRKKSAPDWVVVNMSGPVARGDLWRFLRHKLPRKIILVLSIDDIRNEETRISKNISWERTALDLLSELDRNQALSELYKCRHLIVNFGSAGAIHIDNAATGKRTYSLIFDPARMEGEWCGRSAGNLPGSQACLTAGIIYQVIDRARQPDIQSGIKSGLAAMRKLFQNGHGQANETPGFPTRTIACEIISPAAHYSIAKLPSPRKIKPGDLAQWSIIAGRAIKGKSALRPLYGVARRVALLGPSALREIPFARFGKLFTTDRTEIESLRNIQQLISQYRHTSDGKKPLSIAVFGPPGSGKSFSIKQIAADLMGKKPATLEFNLSQFGGPDDLIGALHQVRDKVLQGSIPLVFWDEFDSGNYKWLQYLLAPMQDGKFQEGQITHPIGKCVFIFAGGTSYTMENFGPASADRPKYEHFKMVKGPDFASRLNGYLNVLGPNRRQKCEAGDCFGAEDWLDDRTDICFPIRRALLIRVVLGLSDGDRLRIDSGLLTALLEAGRYLHGARSLETILVQLKGNGGGHIRRSNLPLDKTLSLHVNADQFLQLINRDIQFMKAAADIAPAVHQAYQENSARERSYVAYRKTFAKLPDNIKQDNIAAAARIPQVLGHVGLYVVPKKDKGSDNPSLKSIRSIIEDNIEVLAEFEHSMWMEEKLRDGWRYGIPRNDDNRIHHSLVPYDELSESDKQKDRNQVRMYLEFVDKAGYKIATEVKWQ